MAQSIVTALPPAFQLIGQPSHPGPADKVSQRMLQIGLQNPLPAQWAADKYAQTNHFTGAVRLAIQPYLDAIGSAKFRVLEKKSRLVKSMGGSGNYSQDDEYEPADPDHPLCKVLEMPGGETGVWSIGQECAYLTLQHLLTGDAPVWTPGNEGGKPVQFYALTAATVTAQFMTGNPMYPNGAYRVTPYAGGSAFYMGGMTASTALLPGEEVRFFRQPHPWARNWGMSALQSGAKEVDILEAIGHSRWSYFDQALQLDCLITVPGASDSEVLRLQEELRQKHGGARNARRAMVIGGAFDMQGGKPASVQQLGPGARELDFNSSFEQCAGYVLAFFRVPKALVNLTETGGSYQSVWAVRQMFYDLGLQPYGANLSVFLTQTLANPWCEFPGQYKIEVEIPQPENREADNENWKFGVTNGLFTHNQSLRRLNLPTVGPDGDVPTQIYTAKLQQEVAPPPMPGADPMAALAGGGDDLPPTDTATAAPAGDDEPGAGTPEGAQDAITQAALASLGIGGELPPDVIEKARQTRAEGAKWQGSNGQWYTKRNNKIVAIANPNPNAQGRFGSKHNEAITYGNAADRDSDDRRFDKKIGVADRQVAQARSALEAAQKRGDSPEVAALRKQLADADAKAKQARAKVPTPPAAATQGGAHPGGIVNVAQVIESHGGESNKAFDKIRERLSQHMAAGGKASLWIDGKETPVAKVENGKIYDAKGAPHGLLPLAAGKPGTKTGVEFHPVQQASPQAAPESAAAPASGPPREELHAAILKMPGAKQFGFNAQNLARMTESAVRSLAAQLGVGPAEALTPHVEKLPQTPAVQQAAQTAGQWAVKAADRHADAVAQHFGISREQAHRLLTKAITAVGEHAAKGVTIRDTRTGKTATLTRKALDPSKEWHDPAPYGYCPECREPGICCERRPNGNAYCANEHAYPRDQAKYACVMVELKGATAKAIKALGKQIADADLGEDGRETEPHVTARYGLHADAALPIVDALRGFGPVSMRLGALKAFRGAESGNDYDVIYAEVDSPDLHQLHAALGALPHTDTHPEYHPHATIAYVKAGLADKYLAVLQALDAEEQATEVDFSTAKREHTMIPLVERKAMSAYDDGAGAVLVPSAEVQAKRRKKKRALVDSVLKSLGVE